MRALLLVIVTASCGSRVMEDPQPGTDSAVTATQIVEIVTGSLGTCVVRGDGTVWCWGFNQRNELVGGGCAEACVTPTQVAGFGDVIRLTRPDSGG